MATGTSGDNMFSRLASCEAFAAFKLGGRPRTSRIPFRASFEASLWGATLRIGRSRHATAESCKLHYTAFDRNRLVCCTNATRPGFTYSSWNTRSDMLAFVNRSVPDGTVPDEVDPIECYVIRVESDYQLSAGLFQVSSELFLKLQVNRTQPFSSGHINNR